MMAEVDKKDFELDESQNRIIIDDVINPYSKVITGCGRTQAPCCNCEVRFGRRSKHASDITIVKCRAAQRMW
jgi:hypothetical protein